MNIIQKFINYIERDVKAEKESKEPAILLRLMCLIDTLCFGIVSVFSTYTFGSKSALSFCIFGAVIIALFFCSSKVSTVISISIYSLVTAFAVVYLTFCFGIAPMYHVCLFTLIFMIHFQIGFSKRVRVGTIVASCAIACFLIAYSMHNGPFFPVSPETTFVLISINSLCLFLKMMTVALMYYRKFSITDEKILKYAKKLETFAVQDTLTKLYNRRGMFNYLDNIEKRLESSPDFLSIAIGDIDFFKKVNDTYGHEAGDYVLVTVAQIIKKFMENKGCVSRWGGEEFLFSFEGKNGDEARGELEKLRSRIANYEFKYNDLTFHVTMTFGVEEYAGFLGIEKTINNADQKLYEGKKSGRNKVVF